MLRTMVGISLVLLLSAVLIASPCVLCFKPPVEQTAHDCCKKKPQAPGACGLVLSELVASDAPAAKVAVPAVAPLGLPSPAMMAPALTWMASPTVRAWKAAPPPLYLLDSALRI